MSIRKIGVLLAGAIIFAAAATGADAYVLEQSQVALAKTKKKGQAARATTVKSSKSNTSDRMGGGGGKGAASRATTVKSSKSNTSDRMGGGGGMGVGLGR